MCFLKAQAVAVSFQTVTAIHLHWHVRPLALEVFVKDVWVQHPTNNQRVKQVPLWFELGVNLLYGRHVVLDDVVTNQYISVLKDGNPNLGILIQLRLVPVVNRTAVNRSNVPDF